MILKITDMKVITIFDISIALFFHKGENSEIEIIPDISFVLATALQL